MRICWRAVAVVLAYIPIVAAGVRADETERQEPDIDMFATMTGRCTTLNVDERDFACTSVAFSHSPGGRSSFTIPLNDPDDQTHIITFSGDNGRREQDDLYVLSIDQLLVKSKDRPRADGLPIPLVQPSKGTCKQVGNLVVQQVSSVSCSAIDDKGRKYELAFESDGSPIRVRMISAVDPDRDEPRTQHLAAHLEQLKCRQMAVVQHVLPRDRTAFILKCMEDE